MSATGLYRSIQLDWTNPTSATFANTEIWRAATNDRTGAVRIAAPEGLRGAPQTYIDDDLTPMVTWYYWRRPRHFDGTFDAYDPVSSTGGWSATVESLPGEDLVSGYRVVALTDAATVTPNADTTDMGTLATLSQATLFANPTGTPLNGQELIIRILSSTSRALTYGTQYRSTTGFALPTATTGGGIPDYLVFRWHAGDSKWDCVLQTAMGSMFTTEQAQDAVGAMVDASLVYVDATPLLTRAALTGDVTASQGSNATTVVSASDTVAGKVELATIAETNTGTDTARAVTPDGLAGSNYGLFIVTLQCSDPNGAALTTGDGKQYWRVPAALNGFNLVSVALHVTTASTSGLPTFQIHNVTQAADMLTTKVSCDANEKDSSTATTAAVIDAGNDDVATGDELRCDCDIAGTGTKGAMVELGFQLP